MPISIWAACRAYSVDMGRGQQAASTRTAVQGSAQSAVTRFDNVLGPGRGSKRGNDSPLEGLSTQRAENEKERLLAEVDAGRPEEALRVLLRTREDAPSPHLEELRSKFIAHYVARTIRRWKGAIDLAADIVCLPSMATANLPALSSQLTDILEAQIFDSSPRTQAELDSLGNDEMPLAIPTALAFGISPYKQEVVEGLFQDADLDILLSKAPPRERDLDRIIELMEMNDWYEALEKTTWSLPIEGDLDESEKVNVRTTCRGHVIDQFYKALERQKLRNLDISTPQER